MSSSSATLLEPTHHRITLQILQPDGSVSEVTSETESLILGSGTGASVRIDDPTVSSLHLMLKVDRRQNVLAIDLGSEQGSFIKDSPLRVPAPISSGDVLRIGNRKIRVHFGAPRSVAAVAAPRPEVMAVPPGLRARPVPVEASAVSELSEPALPPPPAQFHPQPKPVHGATAVRTPALPRARVPSAPRPMARGEASAWRLLTGPTPAHSAPSESEKALQVSMLWGDQILGVEHFGDNVPVTLGDTKKTAFQLFAPSVGKHFELGRTSGDTATVRVPKGGEITLYSGDAEKSSEWLRQEGRLKQEDGVEVLQLGLRERAQVRIGTVGLGLRFVRPAEHIIVRETPKEDMRFLAIALVCLFLGSIGVAVATFGSHPGPTAADNLETDQAMVKLLAKKDPPPKPKKTAAAETKKDSGAEEGAKAKDEEGKAGKMEAKRDEADPSRKGTPIVDPRKQERDRKKVMSAGLLGALGKGSASNVFGPGGLGNGINNALGGLKAGAGIGDAHGVGGLGSRGNGTGGGGAGLGLGGLGTQGKGNGAGGYGSIDLGGKSKDTVRVVPGKTTVVGGLSKDIIAKVIKQHQSEIKYCYEVEMQKNPDLAGKVAVLFNIDGSGVVTDDSVTDTTLGNASTESCMLQKIKRWKFPEAVGGGVTSVTFPWVFKPAGAE